MINQLQRIVEENYENGSQLSRLPNNQDFMNKINEIINVVNKMEKEYIHLKHQRELDSIHIGTRTMK